MDSLITFNVALQSDVGKSLHSHDFHEFILCTSGRGVQYVPSTEFEIRPGDFFFFPPGQPHFAKGIEKKPCTVTVIYLPINFFSPTAAGDADCCRVLDALRDTATCGNNRIHFTQKGTQQARTILRAMLTEAQSTQKGYLLAQKIFMQNFILTVLREATLASGETTRFQGRSAEQRIRDFCVYLDHNFSHDMSVAHAMAMTHMSRSHFHAVFKKITGAALVDYINRRRSEEVVRLARQKNISLESIAAACGFHSLSHLRHTVKKYLNTTPGQVSR